MEKPIKQAFPFFMTRGIYNRSISSDRARRVPFGTTMEHVVRRICDDITRMWCWLHLRITNNEPVTNDVSAQIINGERLNDQNKTTRHR